MAWLPPLLGVVGLWRERVALPGAGGAGIDAGAARAVAGVHRAVTGALPAWRLHGAAGVPGVCGRLFPESVADCC